MKQLTSISKSVIILYCLMYSSASLSQQSPQFAQFMFNGFGNNPAYLSNTKCFEVVTGRRVQWFGLDNAPKSNFFGAHKVITKMKGFKSHWHAIGLFYEQDKNQLMGFENYYLSYSFHMRVSREYVLSYGIFAGARRQTMGLNFMSSGDPVLASYNTAVWIYPHFTPGIRLSSKKTFFDLTVRQLYKNKIENRDKRQGSPSSIVPHFYYTMGTRFESESYYFSYIPAIHIKYGMAGLPSVDMNTMIFYKDMIGTGITYRYHDAIAAILQLKLMQGQVRIGLAYEYPVSKMRYTGLSTYESMMGFAPCSSNDDFVNAGKTNCPTFDF